MSLLCFGDVRGLQDFMGVCGVRRASDVRGYDTPRLVELINYLYTCQLENFSLSRYLRFILEVFRATVWYLYRRAHPPQRAEALAEPKMPSRETQPVSSHCDSLPDVLCCREYDRIPIQLHTT